jgi:hypothetical protein
MNSYDSIRQLISDTLTNRALGLEIQPEAHEKMDLAILDYIKEVESVTTSTLMGIAEVDTAPVQPNDSNVVYLGTILSDSSNVYINFKDLNGIPITVSTGDDESYLLAFIWNKSYWTVLKLSTSVIAKGDNQQIYYQLKSRKFYASYSDMISDTSLIGFNGKVISVGEFVTVYNSSDTSKNGVYVRINGGWSFISALNLGITSEINMDETYPLQSGYYNLTTAIAKVDTALRAINAKITFASAEGIQETYQYTNSNIANWNTVDNWEILSITGKYGNLGIVTNLDTIARTGNYTVYGTATGAPSTTYSWFIEHINSSAGTVTAYQRAIAYSTDNIVYERTKIGSTWESWIRNPNLADITILNDNKVDKTQYNVDLPKKVDKTTKINDHELSSDVNLTKDDIGLSNVDNTSDNNKPISTLQQQALNEKLDSSKIIILSEDAWDALTTKVEGAIYLIYTE